MLDQAGQLYYWGSHPPEDAEHKLKELHAKIGQLTMERDFLEQGLEMINRTHELPVARQSQLLNFNRFSV